MFKQRLPFDEAEAGDRKLDVPVFVDAMTDSSWFPSVRCSFLTIEVDGPVAGWELRIRNIPIPVMLLGLAAVVTRPIAAALFRAPQDFEELLRLGEAEFGWTIQTDDIWLPARLFRNAYPGEVYRVGSRLFLLALRYRNGAMSQKRFLDETLEMAGEIQISETETKAFQRWHYSVINEHPIEKQADLRLRDIGERGDA